MKLLEKEVDAYERECRQATNRLTQTIPPFREAGQLLNIVQEHFSIPARQAARPKVIVLGSAFPEELIHAFGVTPYWILGGSLQTGAWAGELAPRDADPVSRAMLGLLTGLEELTRDALILLPIVSDSTRKLAYLLRREGLKIHTVDLPPQKVDADATKYERQLELCAEALSKHTGKRFTLRALRRGAGLVAQAHEELRRFRTLTETHPGLMSAPWRLLVGFSYYCARDIPEWIELLACLNDRIEQCHVYKPDSTNGDVLLMGSPVYFPNDKLPVLLQEVGLHIAAHLDYTTHRTDAALPPEAVERLTLASLARCFYQMDCSAGYAKNDTLQTAAVSLLDSHSIDGVVYCVLKGQIEYDFELERVERLCGKRKIPVFRLETDYNQQDVEQLRIRMEAFMELLRQNRIRKEVRAV